MDSSASSEMVEVTDIEELEVSETDAALLRELLLEDHHDQSEKEMEKDRAHALKNVQVPNANSDYMSDRLQRIEELDVDVFEYSWPDNNYMVANLPPPAPVDETMAWYVDDMIVTGEFDCNIDYSQFYSGVSVEEELTYGCLWQE